MIVACCNQGKDTAAARARRLAAGCHMLSAMLLSVMLLPGAAWADPASGRFEVRSAYAELIDGVYHLNARIDYTLSDQTRQALERGVTLTMEVQIEVRRVRRYFPDKDVASLRQRYQIEFHALTERYVARNLNSGEQASFLTLEAAVADIGVIEELPVIDASLLDPDKRYDIRVRAILDVRDFPRPLQFLAAWFDEWRLASEWYEWRLKP